MHKDKTNITKIVIIILLIVTLLLVLLYILNNVKNNRLENSAIESESGIDISKHVDLTMYLIGTRPADMDLVLEKLNKLTERDLNVSLKIEWIGWGDFSKEYPILLSSGQPVDLVYASNWLNFYENAQRGAFLELNDLLEKYAPISRINMSEAKVKDVSVNDKIYAIPSDYTNYNTFGPIVRKDYMRKYNVTSFNNFEDYIDFCCKIGKNENIDPTGLCSSSIELDDLYLMSKGYYPLSGSGSLYWIDLNDQKHKVYFESDCPAMKYFLTNAKKWYESGCWNKDVLSSKDETMLESNKAVSRVHNYDAWLGESGKDNELELDYFNLTNPLYKVSANQDCMAIPNSSNNPERALMLLEKLKYDEEYYMLITYGIEGYNYVLKDDKIEFLNDTYGNEPGTWGFRNETFYKQNMAVKDEQFEYRKNYEKTAMENPMAGFYMNLSEIQKEYENLKYTTKLYFDPLVLGYVDYEEGMKMLNDNLKENGNDKVIEHLQKQVDEYYAK
ncbi:MAG: extracellular solute-binding protein [Lachnospiraceae bacterium]|nr:extracellular solute-binding protein [Lachnospiraceae bacterium]